MVYIWIFAGILTVLYYWYDLIFNFHEVRVIDILNSLLIFVLGPLVGISVLISTIDFNANTIIWKRKEDEKRDSVES